MRAYIVRKGSQGLEGLERCEREKPEPGADEVLLRVRAASLNYRDQMVVSGSYFGGAVTRDTVPLSDGAGEVVATGPKVSRFKIGDQVAGTFFQGWVEGPPKLPPPPALGSPLDGMLAEYVALDQEGLVPVPGGLSIEEAATLPCAAVTAWNALMVKGHLKAGDTVLAMGTGGVSIFALQFAKAVGAKVIITSSSDQKLERARTLGADEGINYLKTPDWEQEVLRLTKGQGVDHVVEVGGVGTLARSFQAVGCGGNVSLIGVLAGREGDTNPSPLMLKGASLTGIFVGNRAMFEDMNSFITEKGLKPVIDRVFPFEEAEEAYKYQMTGRHFGKIVIRL
ncbi:MAG: NAD(P)-dependent alcohol dehydrogenase [Sphingomonadales bacterium]